MKIKSLLVSILLGTSVMAQTPSYIPTTGLMGYWGFEGNANDLSINGNNGTVNGATLTTDRFGLANSAYYYNGTSSNIAFTNQFVFNQNTDATVSLWINRGVLPNVQGTYLYTKNATGDANRFNFYFQNASNLMSLDYRNPVTLHQLNNDNSILNNTWVHVLYTRIGSDYKLYLNGVYINTATDVSPNLPNSTGWLLGADPTSIMDYLGKIDDVGIWNRALTQLEITALFNGCIDPVVTLAGISPFVEINENPITLSGNPTGGTYSGDGVVGNTFTPLTAGLGTATIRYSFSDGSCSDSTSISTIVYDTTGIVCTSFDTTYVTVTDTIYTSVTDTLFINVSLGLTPPNNVNTIQVYPNPTSDHITIDNGNYVAMAGYSLKIQNNVGQEVFSSPINQQQFIIDLSTWLGNGIYFIHIIDTQSNTVDVRKIVLQ